MIGSTKYFCRVHVVTQYSILHFLLKAPIPDDFRGIHKGEGAGQKYADEVKSIITKANEEGKQVGYDMGMYNYAIAMQ